MNTQRKIVSFLRVIDGVKGVNSELIDSGEMLGIITAMYKGIFEEELKEAMNAKEVD